MRRIIVSHAIARTCRIEVRAIVGDLLATVQLAIAPNLEGPLLARLRGVISRSLDRLRPYPLLR